VILQSLRADRAEFEQRTGWALKPQGACKGEVCVPMPQPSGDVVDVAVIAERLNMPLVHDDAAGLWALGPEGGGRALTSAEAPDLRLPDWRGEEFRLRSLRGRKALLVAWASW
jgi:hypothetical protein